MASTKDLETVIKDHNNNDKKQVYRRRFLNFDFAIKIDEQGYLVKIAKGLAVSVTPLEKTTDKPLFTFSASSESWDVFSQKYPPPGYQDVMAMVERPGHVEGDNPDDADLYMDTIWAVADALGLEKPASVTIVRFFRFLIGFTNAS
jgi:hypothetical protein